MESAVGYYLSSLPGLSLAHQPERPGEPEIDFIVTIGSYRIPVEVKYRRRLDPVRDTEGLRRYLDKRPNNAALGLVITQDDEVEIDDPRILPLSLKTLMLVR